MEKEKSRGFDTEDGIIKLEYLLRAEDLMIQCWVKMAKETYSIYYILSTSLSLYLLFGLFIQYYHDHLHNTERGTYIITYNLLIY